MFDCKGCAAKDAENARLWKMLTELTDRYTAMTGTLPQVLEGRERGAMGTPGPFLEPLAEEKERVDWEEQELAHAEANVKRTGGAIRPDFP